MPRNNSLNTGQGTSGGSNGLVRWTFAAADSVNGSPIIDANGGVYVGANDGYLYAIDSSGTAKWKFFTGSGQQGLSPSASIGPDGTIYAIGVGYSSGFSGLQSVMYAVRPNGTQKWMAVTEQSAGAPAVGANGIIYLAGYDTNSQGHTLTAVNSDGTARWAFWLGSGASDGIDSTPAIGVDGTIYAATANHLVAINSNGSLKWSTAIPSSGSSPAIGPDGGIYLGSKDGNLYAVNPDGTIRWAFQTSGAIVSSPAVGSNGFILVGSLDGSLYEVTSFGGQEWSFSTGNPILSSPSIGSDGTTYVASGLASNSGTLFAVNPFGAKAWKVPIGTGAIVSSPAIGSDGTIYIGSADDNLYAIGTQVNTVSISQVAVQPASVVGGNDAVGTVTLDSPAPSGGDVVTLAANDGSTVVPALITIKPGALSASFSISTNPVAVTTVSKISATSGGFTVSYSFVVQPPSLTGISITPASILGGAPTTGTVTLSGPAASKGVVVQLSSKNPAVTIPASVIVTAGSSSATFPIATSAVNQQNSVGVTASLAGVTFSASLTLNPATVNALTLDSGSVAGGASVIGTVSLNGQAGQGGVNVVLQSSSVVVSVPSSVVVAQGSVSANFTLTTTSVQSQILATISATAGGVSKYATLTVSPLALNSITLNPTSIAGSLSATGTVVLTGPAPSTGAVVKLSSSSSVVSVPASVKVAAGSSSASFTAKTIAVSSAKTIAIKATFGSIPQTGTLTVNPPVLQSIGFSPSTVVGGKPVVGSIGLATPAPPGGIVVKIACSSPYVKFSSSVLVPAGRTTGTFAVKTLTVTTPTTTTWTATLGGVTKAGQLILNPRT